MYTMLVLALILFHKGRKHPQSLILAIYAAVEVLTNGLNSLNISAGVEFFQRFPFMHFVYKPLYCLWVPLFYFYFKSCYSQNFRFGKKYWPHFVPFLFFLIYFLMILVVKGNQYIWENLYKEKSLLFYSVFAIEITVRIQYLVYNFLMIRSLIKLEKNRMVQNSVHHQIAVDINWLRFIVYGYAIASIGGIAVFVSVLYFNQATTIINLVSISYFFLFFFVIFYYTITSKLTTKEVKSKSKPQPDSEMFVLMNRIEELVAGKQLYLNHELTLQQIANELNEKERNISKTINVVQKRNLNDYINSLRIEHACKLLLADKEKPVFEVMYESGFSTKGAFNLAFKKVTGKTPTRFKDEHSKDSK
jgi:AraC-like DNA-binding protein